MEMMKSQKELYQALETTRRALSDTDDVLDSLGEKLHVIRAVAIEADDNLRFAETANTVVATMSALTQELYSDVDLMINIAKRAVDEGLAAPEAVEGEYPEQE